MTTRISFAAAIALALGGGAIAFQAAPLRALAGDQDIAFPGHFAAGVLYADVDRADLEQYRELYAPAAAIAAVKQGKPLPAGTVLTMVMYSAKRDPAGKPVTDANGRFTKDELVGYLVMEKRAERPDDVNWRFQVFRADQAPVAGARLSDCVECHQKRRELDFVFTGDRMRASP